MNEYIKSDCYRYFGKTDIWTMIIGFFSNPLFRFQVALRLASGGGVLITSLEESYGSLIKTKKLFKSKEGRK